MTDIRNLLIRGSEKVIGHYRLLLTRAGTEGERQLHLSRRYPSKITQHRLRCFRQKAAMGFASLYPPYEAHFTNNTDTAVRTRMSSRNGMAERHSRSEVPS